MKKKPVLVLDPEELARAHLLFQQGAAEQLEMDRDARPPRQATILNLAPITRSDPPEEVEEDRSATLASDDELAELEALLAWNDDEDAEGEPLPTALPAPVAKTPPMREVAPAAPLSASATRPAMPKSDVEVTPTFRPETQQRPSATIPERPTRGPAADAMPKRAAQPLPDALPKAPPAPPVRADVPPPAERKVGQTVAEPRTPRQAARPIAAERVEPPVARAKRAELAREDASTPNSPVVTNESLPARPPAPAPAMARPDPAPEPVSILVSAPEPVLDLSAGDQVPDAAITPETPAMRPAKVAASAGEASQLRARVIREAGAHAPRRKPKPTLWARLRRAVVRYFTRNQDMR